MAENKINNDKEDDSIDFLRVNTNQIKENMHNEVEKKLLSLKNHFNRITNKLQRFLNEK